MALYAMVHLNYQQVPSPHSMHHHRNRYNYYIQFKNIIHILKEFVIKNCGGMKSENGGE